MWVAYRLWWIFPTQESNQSAALQVDSLPAVLLGKPTNMGVCVYIYIYIYMTCMYVYKYNTYDVVYTYILHHVYFVCVCYI